MDNGLSMLPTDFVPDDRPPLLSSLAQNTLEALRNDRVLKLARLGMALCACAGFKRVVSRTF